MGETCHHCGTQFTATGARGRRPKYCSATCRQRAHRERSLRPWPQNALGQRWARADGKRPIQLDGTPASSTNPDTWTTYDKVSTGDDLPGDGYGVMLGDGLGCYDLDNATTADGSVKIWAAAVLDTVLHDKTRPAFFVERSVSGTGLHVFVEADEQRGQRRSAGDGSVEFYSWARFIRVTGETVHV